MNICAPTSIDQALQTRLVEPCEGVVQAVSLGPDAKPTLGQAAAVASGRSTVHLTDAAHLAMAQSEAFLNDLIAQGRCIYGVTTGYGPLANNHIDPRCSDTLQRNLVYHLASGVGAPLPWLQARSIVFARLSALSQGHSAVSRQVTDILAASLNAGLAPVIPEKGTVGASGDLTPLAHVALALMGEGGWLDAGGPVENSAAFKRIGFTPLCLGPKEGLALVNGTSAMTGIAALNGVLARQAIVLTSVLSLMNAEMFSGHRAAWHPNVGAVRGQPGQQRMHQLLWSLSESSNMLQPFAPLPGQIGGEGAVRHGQIIPQDPYSIRCVTQLIGASLDVLETHDAIIARELAAVTDNPLVFAEQEVLLHAGNFFGQHTAFASDALANAVIMLGVLLERQIARITDVKQSEGLPAFLQGNQTGLNSGFMGAQVTASALVAEIRTQAIPASVQSIPTNANNQDVVTMGTIAARKTSAILADAYRIIAIQALCMAQAYDLRINECDCEDFSQTTRALHAYIRQHAAFLDVDRPLSSEIEGLAQAMQNPLLWHEIFADL
ncbi:MAG: aromatic amino acid ammonia-lyase, partial [Pseudomonadota bacterium]